MAVCAATHRHNTHQLISGNLTQRRGGQLLRHEYSPFGVIHITAVRVLQVPQHTSAQISNIHRPLPEVGMLHPLKMPYVAQHDLTKRTLGPLSRFDQRCHFAAQRRIIQNAQIYAE